jgi:hypothetical protein
MTAAANSARKLTPGNTAGLLEDVDLVNGGRVRTGATCKSDTLLLFQNYWVQTNVSGKLRVRAADGREPHKQTANGGGGLVDVFFQAGVPSAFLVSQISATGSAAIADTDIVLIS